MNITNTHNQRQPNRNLLPATPLLPAAPEVRQQDLRNEDYDGLFHQIVSLSVSLSAFRPLRLLTFFQVFVMYGGVPRKAKVNRPDCSG